MPVGIDGAAAYRPGQLAPDEDAFTLAATALERLDDLVGDLPANGRLLVGGDLPSGSEPDLGRFLGHGVRVVRTDGAGTLEGAVSAEPGAARVVWVESVSRDASTGAPAAVAFRTADPAGSPAVPEPEGGSLLAPLLRLGAERAHVEPARWFGDFRGPEAGRSGAAPGARPELPSEGPVSQGAYVPRPRYLETVAARWRFVGERCSNCGRISFPRRGRCPGCESTTALEAYRLPREGGTVVASTTIGPGGQPTEFDLQVGATGPYSVLLVELVPGVRVTLQATDSAPGSIGLGARIATRLRRLYPMEGEWRYGRKVVPGR